MRICKTALILLGVIPCLILGQEFADDAERAFYLKDWKSAADAYMTRTAMNPNDGMAWYRLGFALDHLGDSTGAAASFEKAALLKFSLSNSLLNAASEYAPLGKKDKAFDLLNQYAASILGNSPRLPNTPELASLRDDPRWMALNRKLQANVRRSSRKPAWSPDGKRIAFSSDRAGKMEIYIMNADGANPRRLGGGNAAMNDAPSFSPDGHRIAYVCGADWAAPSGTRDICVMNSDGGEQRQLTHGPGNNHYPAFSPNGKRIVFNSDRDGHREIYTIPAEGGSATRLTQTQADSDYPAYSADGKKIIFESQRSGFWQIYLMNPDGSNQQVIHRRGSAPDLSSDGARVVFHESYSGDFNVYSMKVDGSDLKALTSDPGFDGEPRWSPNGRRIAFHSDRSGSMEVYVMDADGSNVKRLTVTKSIER